MSVTTAWYWTQCHACGQWHFPPRRRCMACGDLLSESVPMGRIGGVVAQATALLRAPGLSPGEARHLVTVETELGPRVIARASQALVPGTRVRLVWESNRGLQAQPIRGESC